MTEVTTNLIEMHMSKDGLVEIHTAEPVPIEHLLRTVSGLRATIKDKEGPFQVCSFPSAESECDT